MFDFIFTIECDTIVIGDSQTKYLRFGPAIKLQFRRGRKLDEIDNKFCEKLRIYKNVVFHLGTNNIPCESPSSILQKFIVITQNLRRVNPEAAIFYSSILPRYWSHFKPLKDEWQSQNTKAKIVNEQLQKCCERYVPILGRTLNTILNSDTDQKKNKILIPELNF